MKKWSRPVTMVQKFEANEYVAACGDSGFYDGYMYLQDWRGNNSGSPIDVVIWTDRGTDVHCTTNLDMDEWETAKS